MSYRTGYATANQESQRNGQRNGREAIPKEDQSEQQSLVMPTSSYDT